MITNGKCRMDAWVIAGQLRENTDLPISVLICPTIMSKSDLEAINNAGVDKIGIAIDLATPQLFEKHRGTGVNGPHRWETYWDILITGLDMFHSPHVGAHLIVGMGETEHEMVTIMAQLWQLGVVNHLFSFFPEKNSQLSDIPQPPWSKYLRIQLLRYLIEEGMSSISDMAFDDEGRIIHFGVNTESLDDFISLGMPFMTTGCLDSDGCAACNRPFGNCLPDVRQWNYPYQPNKEEIALIRKNIFNNVKK